MRITRLLLRNYRVYEDQLELELPPGLVGVFGPNGSGKSLLVEAIPWVLYGHSRTANDQVRTAGVNGECVTEVEFEHEGHLYVVRRTIGGSNHTVKAQAHADGLHVAEGVRDTSGYVRSVLGMDDAAFRASVFAEQKQVAAFSTKTPAERRRLVLQLLGITPLDAARDAARRDARGRREVHDRLRAALPSLDERRAAGATADAAAADAVAAAAGAVDEEQRAAAAANAARARHEELVVVQHEHEALVTEGKAAKRELQDASERAARLTDELEQLQSLDAELARLRPEADGLEAAESRLARLQTVAAAESRLAALPPLCAPPDPADERGCEAAGRVAEEAATRLAGHQGLLTAAAADLERARHAVERSAVLSGAAGCPLCGQELGDAFEEVQRHRHEELHGAERRHAELAGGTAALEREARSTARAAKAAAGTLKQAGAARAEFDAAVARRAEAEREVATAVAAVRPAPRLDELEALTAEVTRRRVAAARAQQLAGRLHRAPAATAELEAEHQRAAECGGRVETLRDKVRALGFRPDQLAAAATARQQADSGLDAARARARSLEATAATAAAAAAAAAGALAEAESQHERVAGLADDVRHVGRAAELLGAFRDELVGTVGPVLSNQAAALFGELTDHEYDELRVDPETYEVRVVDKGVDYGMDRFSGSEIDLANLALRVAISEHVRFQSGGQVGLLVLDEVFGPLDDDRKERMLRALEGLRGRFRQVLVVTHDAEVKEQLPAAIEVRKLGHRRATAATLDPW